MSRIDILIERAKQRAESEKQQVGNATTSGDQVEYLVRSGLLHRCEDCRSAVEHPITLHGGRKVCGDCYTAAAEFQDTQPP